MSQCQSRSVELADHETRQGTGINACGGTGHKGTKLCDRTFDHGDPVRVTLLVDDANNGSPLSRATCRDWIVIEPGRGESKGVEGGRKQTAAAAGGRPRRGRRRARK